MNPEELYLTYVKAINIISKASAIVMEGFHKRDKVQMEKSPLDLVTEYDCKVEDYMKSELKRHFPNHEFLGEETSNSVVVPTGLTWILDPIDGTSNFVHAAPESAISLALTLDKEPLIGIISCPVLQRLYSACKGRGSFLNGSPIHTSSVKSIRESLMAMEISIGAKSTELLELMGKRTIVSAKNCQGIRSIGSAALSLAYVAQGIWDVYHTEGLYPWDFAAGVILIREAGGHVTDSLGGNFDIENSKILAANSEAMSKNVANLFKSVE